MEDFIPYSPLTFDQQEMIRRSQEFYSLMNKRRSVRHFSEQEVPMEVLKNILLTAGTAPSGAHMQPWFFALVTDKELKSKIREAAEEEEKRNYEERMSEQWKSDLAHLGTDFVKSHITDAPALIVVFKQAYRIVDGKRIKNYYINESVGIASGILISAIHNAGLVTLTHTPSPMKFLSTLLNRPDTDQPFLLMPVGYPNPEAEVPNLQRKSLSEISKIY